MKLGFHVSISGGMERAFERAAAKNCGTMQIFSRNPRGWKFKDLDEATVAAWHEEAAKYAIEPVVIHMPYLPNLAASDKTQYSKSLHALVAELDRAETLRCPHICTHIGKRLGAGNDAALAAVATIIDTAIEEAAVHNPMLLLENTAGQGSEVGNRISEIAAIVASSAYPDRLGLCIDTCHAHAAGYDMSTAEGLTQLIAEIEAEIGLEKLRVIHLNDSKGDCGSSLDRHAHLGQGSIGEAGIARILQHPKLAELPFIMETPENDDGDDASNMATALRLAQA